MIPSSIQAHGDQLHADGAMLAVTVGDKANVRDAAARELARRYNLHDELVHALEDVLALTQPWPLRDAVAKLVEAAQHLTRTHGCDRHGHEETSAAMYTAAALLPKIDAAQAVLLRVRKR